MDSETTTDCNRPRLPKPDQDQQQQQRSERTTVERGAQKVHRRTLSTAPASLRSATMKNSVNARTVLLATINLTLVVFLLNPTSSPSTRLVEGGILKTAKTLAKGIVMQQLTSRKNFLPLPVPIPVPIEINDPPVYIKGKPKYVNVYKPKPTPQPVVKPTTVYHMPVYSPTYEYMSMDPMSMYGSMVYPAAAPASSAYGSLKSSIHTDSDSSATAGINFNDYDDEFGNYYVGKSSAAKRRRRMMQLNSIAGSHNDELLNDFQRSDSHQRQQQQSADHGDGRMMASGPDGQPMLLTADDEEQVDGETAIEHRRSKRQVYYQSGYDGEKNCHGFPLEINVRSRIKMHEVFPIYGKSQMKKCIKVGKPLLPPVEDYPQHY